MRAKRGRAGQGKGKPPPRGGGWLVGGSVGQVDDARVVAVLVVGGGHPDEHAAVLQMIDRGKMPARQAGNTWVMALASVEALL